MSRQKIRHTIRQKSENALAKAASGMPPRLRRFLVPIAHYGDMLLLDHLFIRVVFPNRHQFAPRAWRAAQPLPYQLRHLKRLKIRTVINLRGNSGTTTHRFEKQVCERLGISYVDFPIPSRAAPTRSQLRALRDLYREAEHPILLHCKAGADRAGLASALYLHYVEGIPIIDAKHQLSLRYGHIRQSDTGVLDSVLERYLDHAAQDPLDFMTWVETYYDPQELNASFRAKNWANRIVNGILRRE
ncbi:MAG: protein tyrosine phosphatase [Hyphomicrobium sp. 32-62-53]|nr:MAG: protein tyrosine phosphatase [Hyphomicrobium sp. 12-62-95]OYX97443.1 MAG: protein tyrosine phosphatase [Hyphomicrobium sp. 32-62-53]